MRVRLRGRSGRREATRSYLGRYRRRKRRRVRLYYWKQPRTRRRHLLALGIPPEQVHLAGRSRKGYWRMSGNGILQRALTNRRLHERGAPDLRALWIVRHYGPLAVSSGTAGCGPVRPLRGEISIQADMSGGVGPVAD